MSRRLRRRGDSGAAMLEFAIVTPLVILLLMGIIDFGFLFNDTLQVRQGTREGARQGAVGNFGDFGAEPTCPGVQSNGASKQGTRLICRTRASIGLSTSTNANEGMRVRICLPSKTTAGTCSNSTVDYVSGDNNLVVCTMYPRKSVTGTLSFLANGNTTDRVVIRIEQLESQINGIVDDMKTTSEPALTGSNWSFCVP